MTDYVTYTDEQRAKFHKHIVDLLKKMEQRDELEVKLHDWFLFFVDGDGTSTPENTLAFKQAQLGKLLRMQKRINKQVNNLRPEVDTLRQIVRNRAPARDYANGSSPKNVPDL